jgi:outer membrane protein
MRKLLLATSLFSALAFGGNAHAQSMQNFFDFNAPPVGKEANTIMIRIRAIGVMPEDNGSSVSAVGGKVDVTAQPAPEIDFSYFFTENIAAELIAATTRHEVSVSGSALPGKIDVGSAWILPPTLTLQYHFMPHSAFSPYVGAGLNVSWFYDSQPATPTVTKFTLNNTWGPALQVGFDYNFGGHWFANFDVKQIFMHDGAHVSTVLGQVKANVSIDPLIVGAGIGYRF